jgi:hypothetical protein
VAPEAKASFAGEAPWISAMKAYQGFGCGGLQMIPMDFVFSRAALSRGPGAKGVDVGQIEGELMKLDRLIRAGMGPSARNLSVFGGDLAGHQERASATNPRRRADRHIDGENA